jgi:hypothetical protein
MTEVETLSEPRPEHLFAHASEAEFARILDFYQVAWEYEPQVFPILWDLDGNVLESFAPDFYLPDMELFVELTTLQQRLVRKKNRKVRRLRELYPDVRIKLFYARDFRALMLKYGRAALAEELSGTMGQVMPQARDAEIQAPVAVDAPAAPAQAESPAAEQPAQAESPAAEQPAQAESPAAEQPAGEPPASPERRSRSARRRAARRAAAAYAPSSPAV